MPVPPCLAYLLGTPDEPGAVVTYRCSRPAGHGPIHDGPGENGAQLTWEDPGAGVVWSDDAIYPVHPDRYPWNDDPAPPGTVPPLPTTPTPTDDEPADGNPWARARADAIAARTTHQLRS